MPGSFSKLLVSSTDLDQHVAGVSWLVDRIRSGNTDWLLMRHQMENASHNEFDAIAALSGDLINSPHLSCERFRFREELERSNSITKCLIPKRGIRSANEIIRTYHDRLSN